MRWATWLEKRLLGSPWGYATDASEGFRTVSEGEFSEVRNNKQRSSNRKATRVWGYAPSPASPLWGTHSQNVYICTVHIYEEHVESARSLKLLSPAAPASEAGREVATCRY